MAREDRSGDKHLVGYVVCAPEAASNGPDGGALAGALRAHVSAHLPDYMVPSAFVRVAALPLTPNGKLDRQALPAPEDEAYARRSYEPPQGEIETALATLWAELLGLERVGRHDHFFELGGQSLLAVRLLEPAVAGVAWGRAAQDVVCQTGAGRSGGERREESEPLRSATPDRRWSAGRAKRRWCCVCAAAAVVFGAAESG
ncbi:phosphopantetheine-binding protein (plasmid) [Bradyrhizobium sp. CCGUVB23]|nr:phosphopantetheine-binding protein [Bradyrhizobium sp. CCGUVB23]MCP3468526.1 phosphopantetheine-binding protein [Bradyrhizobium sp. CCGUVB23]